jgi:hypothetical protein
MDAGPLPTRRRPLGLEHALLAALLLVLAWHAFSALSVMALAQRYPYELDYGEGIVWQQALLIPGPLMYGTSQDLPFIVFHYPPLYYFAVHAMRLLQPDMLAAGRLVSIAATLLLMPIVAGLVVLACPRPATGRTALAAMIAALMIISMYPVFMWGTVMRVDVLAVTLSMLGMLVGARADGRFLGTTIALLLCAASVFTKQTQLTTGVAVFMVAMLRNPRAALGATGVAAVVSLAALGLLQYLTNGGFLRNIIGYNINRFSLHDGLELIWAQRRSFPVGFLAALAATGILVRLAPVSPKASMLQWFRKADRATAVRVALLLNFALASLMLVTLFKSGSASNYVVHWLCLCAVLIGVGLADLQAASIRSMRLALAALALAVLAEPRVHFQEQTDPVRLAQQAALVQLIAAADKPVASENMVLLMRAGKQVMFEPAIVTELAAMGRWDQRPLLAMLREHRFAFVITCDQFGPDGARRTPEVDQAIREAYPVVREAAPDIWVNSPG